MPERPIGPGPLAGLRVLDLTEERGALATKQLAELGAEVALIEPPGGLALRRVGPFLDDRPGPDRGLTFAYFHAGHRSVVADLATAEGRELVRSLAAGADVLIEDRAPGELTGHGLGEADLRAINRDLIYVALSPFGQTGPRRGWRATDLIGWAAGGPMSVTGPVAGPPLRPAGNQADQMGGLWATIGALAAVYARGRTGRGQLIDVSLQEAVIAANDTVGFTAIYTGRPARRRGSEHVALAPQRVMRARDGYIMIAIVTQGQWQEFLALLREDGAAGPLERPEWHQFLGRLRDRDTIHTLIEEWVATKDRFALMEEAQRRGLPIAALSTPTDVLADPHLADRGFWTDQPVADRRLPVPAGPYLSSSPLPRLGAAPEVDESKVQSPKSKVTGWATRPPSNESRSGDSAGAKSVNHADRATLDFGLWTLDSRRGPLHGVRVLDFGWMIAGAFGAAILGDLGADVIKIEPREVGEPFRGIPPFARKEVGPNTSGAFNLYNRNKRGITLDVRRPEGRDLALRLIGWADVIVENWSAGTFERLGLDEATIRSVNPRVIWVRLAGFGQTGPHNHYVSVAPTLMAATGLTYLTGPVDGPPVGPGVFWADFIGATQGAIAAIAGLIERDHTESGQTIDVAQFEATVRLLGPILLDTAANRRNQTAAGNALTDRPAGPHGAYRCAGPDRWLAIAVTNDAEWEALVGVMGKPAWAAEARFAGATGRAAAAADLDRLIETWTADRDVWEAAARLQAAGVPALPVLDGIDLAERDDHLKARDFYQVPDHPATGPYQVDRSPVVASGTPLPPVRPAPLLGEHTEEILREVLGLDPDAIDRLILDEIV